MKPQITTAIAVSSHSQPTLLAKIATTVPIEVTASERLSLLAADSACEFVFLANARL